MKRKTALRYAHEIARRAHSVNGLAFHSAFFAASILTGCAPNPAEVYGAIADIDAAWKSRDDQILAELGTKDFQASSYQTFVAARQAIEKLGGTVKASDPEKGNIYSISSPASLLTREEWETVKATDSSLVRSILQQHIGIVGMFASLDASDREILANISVLQKEGDGAEVRVSFTMRPRPGAPARVVTSQPPPTAVRIVMNKFWVAFDGELSSALADRSSIPSPPVASPARPAEAVATPLQDQMTSASKSKSTSSSPSSVPMKKQSGIYVVPVVINNAIALDFAVDSGATDVTIPADVVLTLMRTGTLRGADFLGTRTYALADGSVIPSETFRIRSLKVGDKVIENVIGSVADVRGSLLLGQSFLEQFKSWSIDNTTHTLVLQ
jgi:predicted aspartyl protease